MNDDCNGDKEADFVSALPDYAQVFMFLRQFGHMLALPPVSLSELESFFLTRKLNVSRHCLSVWRPLRLRGEAEGSRGRFPAVQRGASARRFTPPRGISIWSAPRAERNTRMRTKFTLKFYRA